MSKFWQSKGAAWAAFIVVLIFLVATFRHRSEWWMFIDVFFIFMAAFLNLVVTYVKNINRPVAMKLNNCAFVSGILFLISFFAEWAAFYF